MQYKDLYWFNPTNDFAVANGVKTYMPPRHLERFSSEMACLPVVFAEPDDLIICKPFSKQFAQLMNSSGFSVPQSAENGCLKQLVLKNGISLSDIKPWGWSPASHFILHDFKSVTDTFVSEKRKEWNDDMRFFYSREFSSLVLKDIAENERYDWLISSEKLPIKCTNAEELSIIMDKWKSCVCKSPWSSSGRGLQFIRYPELNKRILQWLSGCIQKQGFCMIEPIYDKRLDFSLQFEVKLDKSIEYLGYTCFSTTENGQYEFSYLNPQNQLADRPEFRLLQKALPELKDLIISRLTKRKLHENYLGVFGLDCMLVLEGDEFKIHPCLEINLRYTMGYTAMQVEKHLSPDSSGKFCIAMNPDALDLHLSLSKSNKLQYSSNKITSGYIPLTDIQKGYMNWAYADVVS